MSQVRGHRVKKSPALAESADLFVVTAILKRPFFLPRFPSLSGHIRMFYFRLFLLSEKPHCPGKCPSGSACNLAPDRAGLALRNESAPPTVSPPPLLFLFHSFLFFKSSLQYKQYLCIWSHLEFLISQFVFCVQQYLRARNMLWTQLRFY